MYLIQRTTKTNTETKHSITAFRSPQNMPALKIKVTNIISSKNYLTLQPIQVSSSCVHELSVEGWVKGTWVSRNPIKFHQPLPLPQPPPSLPSPRPLLQSFDLTSSSGEPGDHKGVVGKKSVACQLSFYDSLNFILHLKILQIAKLKLVLYNGSILLIM